MKGRQNAIEAYCEKRGLSLTPASPEAIAAYERSMRALIPTIEHDLKAQARAAHYFRLGIPDPALAPIEADRPRKHD